ncbi:S41 family peptidase [Pseudenhygromyxa sp. WMMC2535]|uniref:S41 family peptidase n=1 Tax=Pseudenhygromyxa sp. WMMC2535 TaxID=2712867 RepID=UPI001557CD8F|nr:S41 family peptidase [Pseudenhygromyxa sp. WMMC2535]NVB38841.1 S41 family peptidase [Pseudenhygromyxa sp. WMMC2535]
MSERGARGTVVVGGLCLALGLAGGLSLGKAGAAPPSEDQDNPDNPDDAVVRPAVEPVGEAPADYSRYRKLDRFARSLAIIEQYYVRPVDGEALIDAALRGLVDDLDPHSYYLDPEQAKLLREDTEGRFGGVGLVVTLRREPIAPAPDQPEQAEQGTNATDQQAQADAQLAAGQGESAIPSAHADAASGEQRLVLHIDDVIPGGPAERAGLKIGDRIVEIEGEPISHYSDLLDAVTVMRGVPGTQVRFSYLRDDAPAQALTVTRAIVDPPAVEVRWLGEGMGVLRLRDFQASSAKELRAGLAELGELADAAGEPLSGVAIDLRDNGGGLLDQAIEIADIFIAEGVIVRTRGRQGALLDEARAHLARTERDLPLVVLINKGSASASEIVAGALQDHRRALIIGERSYGKGSVQAPFELGGGALLKLTTALYYTPADRLIQASGIAPDVMVGPLRAEYVDSRPQLEPERAAPKHLRPQDFGRPGVPSDDAPSPARAAAGDDAQLLAAIDHLQAWARLGPPKRGRRR